MRADEQQTTDDARGTARSLQSLTDRYCRFCQEIALVYDPTAEAPRCRACGRLYGADTRSEQTGSS